MRILHAEDDEIILSMVAAMVNQTDHQLDQVTDADAACEALGTRRYDMLLTDYRMGKTTGETAIQCAQAQGVPRIVLCSSEDLSALAEQCECSPA